MKYTILIEKRARKFIERQSKSDIQRILKAIYALPAGDTKPLQGQKSKGFYRLRVGSYRIIYQIENDRLIIRIVDAGNRGQIYNNY